jgi:hypothetical protein
LKIDVNNELIDIKTRIDFMEEEYTGYLFLEDIFLHCQVKKFSNGRNAVHYLEVEVLSLNR